MLSDFYKDCLSKELKKWKDIKGAFGAEHPITVKYLMERVTTGL